ncbi:hypothetical protein RJZ56_004346 [Blastomyces dermatitidis]|uniref:Uncharacterized protein n=3 Tax=Blastomyces TaxID=229219 RepID=A0A179V1N2_BLAGS|nr:hypothetical protein, variant 2 [Blastomyces gilchristii SLH14081]XP_031581334.1 uncharacterized protein BDBG_09296 [Blastomyces gilchristii SLH14081]XP_031581335.1 hypothetical protein, variant 1 [Blastomyces gilchristii SLH14081]XP_045273203.1 uncharacterized protein BDCG_08720 [Blastomyces dermatitidis ER-3]EGE84933.1 hypothetical protein BDDG_07878 [Blastomyces dermatitidis ATCC 18188]EQL33551.1 hypothetical protein BDFG_04478 [Blastomyces dermatitidis ATCC 26199]EEQ85451.1 hypothetica
MSTTLSIAQDPAARNDSSSTSASRHRSNQSHSTYQTAYSHPPMVINLGKGNPQVGVNGRESTDTYASTILSETEEDIDDEPPIELVSDRYEDFPSNPIPSSPPTFGELFPSPRRLLIRHDDTTIDGNMNLRIDTIAVQPGGRQYDITLFHLRMHDLGNRKFSLRRYCRDSGREVCHSARKFNQPSAEMLTALQRPLTNAFSTLRSKSDSIATTTNGLWRQNSGYKPSTECTENGNGRRYSIESLSRPKSPEPTNIIQLEFSNYAHVDVKRRGPKGSKHYDFEYWSTRYQWKRSSRRDGDSKEISFDLYHVAKSKPVAHILTERLTPLEALEERSKGGWIPPCSMWISDPSLYESMKDVADVVVATGLIALVDDSIKRRWNNKRTSLSHTPMTSSFMKSMDSVASNKIIEKVFHRRGSTGSRHSSFRQMFAHA